MAELSGLINEALKTREQIKFAIGEKGHFFLDLFPEKDGRYVFDVKFQGKSPPEDALLYMADFLRGLPAGDIEDS